MNTAFHDAQATVCAQVPQLLQVGISRNRYRVPKQIAVMWK